MRACGNPAGDELPSAARRSRGTRRRLSRRRYRWVFSGVNDCAMIGNPISTIHSSVVADDRDRPEAKSSKHCFKTRQIRQPVGVTAPPFTTAVDHQGSSLVFISYLLRDHQGIGAEGSHCSKSGEWGNQMQEHIADEDQIKRRPTKDGWRELVDGRMASPHL